MKKTVIVTGASRGIGRAISLGLAADGFTVIAAARAESQKAEEYIEQLKKISPESIYVSADISSSEDRIRLVDTVFERFGKLDVLVNNAGVAPTERRDILEMTEESMQRLLDINLKGTFFLTQYAANRMIAAVSTILCQVRLRVSGPVASSFPAAGIPGGNDGSATTFSAFPSLRPELQTADCPG